jgi:RNA polymerase sigma-70 factor (ECF subfamily)
MHTAAVTIRDHHDAELLAAVARGNGRAFEQLYVSYHQRLVRFLLRVAPRQDIAEEIINDTFWIVWRRAKDFRGASRVSTWIMGIAQRRALQALRRARTQGSATPADACATEDRATEAGLAEPHAETEQSDWIRRGLQQLSAEQRASIELAYYLGHSCAEIASIMGCGVPAVKGRIFQARRKLRVALPALAGRTGEARRSRQLTAALALTSIGLILATWLDHRSPASFAAYRTVTEETPVAEAAVIHAVFDPGLKGSELEGILERAAVRVVGGPTPAGVYSLAPRSGIAPDDVRASLALLHRDPRVRFATATIEIGDE